MSIAVDQTRDPYKGLAAFDATDLDAGAVLANADRCDALTMRGRLHGIGIGVKDIIATAALPTGMGSPVFAGVGSTAVRESIERRQPMLGLHGHIHESRGEARLGRTLSLNPGSEYSEGVLRGVIVTLSPKNGVKGFQLVAG